MKTIAILLLPAILLAEPVPVRHMEGLLHGFLVLRSLEGKVLANGEMFQVVNGAQISSELVFRFHDGSSYDETTVFSQRRVFQLIAYHLIQKGPAFKNAMDFSFNCAKGLITGHYTDDHGKQKDMEDHLALPDDLANGMLLTLFNDLSPTAPKTTVSMLVTTPKPRIVKFVITPEGEDSYAVGGVSHKANRYLIKVDIGGISGVVAPILGKQPPDSHVWNMGGKAPGFLRFDGALYEGGPIWRVELASPVWR